ncbi:MAG: type II toxin-antitoxin system prevent-host-death family antitoxin [Dehalococcoidia bacterium]|nr:type II toxin-antitoxin system prevent-host-death family antitoxin [Dehalococcoidia bacterium]
MAKKILAATELRQNLREVLNSFAGVNASEPYYVTQRSRATAVLSNYDAYETLAEKAQEGDACKSALRWCLGFMANVVTAMELQDEPARYIKLFETSAEQGLKASRAPKGVLATLDDFESVMKEWDHKTFRLHQDIKISVQCADSLIVTRKACPPLLSVMRKQAPFHIKRIGWRDYRGKSKELSSDFLCLCCCIISGVMVDWLSGGALLVVEIPGTKGSNRINACSFAVTPKPGDGSQRSCLAQRKSNP